MKKILLFDLAILLIAVGIVIDICYPQMKTFSKEDLGMHACITLGVWILYHQFKRDANWHYITFVGYFTKERYWFIDGWWSIPLFLNNPLRSQRDRWTISTYNTYETIKSVGGFSKRVWVWYYASRGYTQKKENITIRDYDRDSVCSWSPYQNFH